MLTKPEVGTKVRFLGVQGTEDLPYMKKNIGKVGVVIEAPDCYSESVAKMFLDVQFPDWEHSDGRIGKEIFLLCYNEEFEVVE
jgi:hypothetical protein